MGVQSEVYVCNFYKSTMHSIVYFIGAIAAKYIPYTSTYHRYLVAFLLHNFVVGVDERGNSDGSMGHFVVRLGAVRKWFIITN